MKFYSVIKVSVLDMSTPNVEVMNYADKKAAKKEFNLSCRDLKDYAEENDYEFSKDETFAECYDMEDALMDYTSVEIRVNETL